MTEFTGTKRAKTDPPAEEIFRLAEHLFRHESGKLVSTLTGIFGGSRLQLAEDVVQDAMIRAMQTWPYYGIPENPAAWLTQTAKHLALDVIRREKVFLGKEPEIVSSIERSSLGRLPSDSIKLESEIQDDRLSMMFMCCHPMIPAEAQTALALKTLCGFGVPEIAAAFLSTEVAISKRLSRARQRIKEARIPFEIPPPAELSERLGSVLQTLYLLFNEGYKASAGEDLVREDLCNEALRMGALLARHPAGNQPRTHALLALMLLNMARLSGRTDHDGRILILRDQDRSQWSQERIQQGLIHLNIAMAGDELTEYHIQAGIAAHHCTAPDFESTDWAKICKLYDVWAGMDDSPVIALNRAVVVAKLKGPKAGLNEIDAIERAGNRDRLESYYLYYAVLADLQAQLGDHAAASGHLKRALELTQTESERTFLENKLAECEVRV